MRNAVIGGCNMPPSTRYHGGFNDSSFFMCDFAAEPFVPPLLLVDEEECLRGEWWESLGLR